MNKDNRVWLPDNDTRTRVRIAAHCGLAGHRGFHSTYNNVARFFVFDDPKTTKAYVRCFLSKCLQCIRNESGKVRPLPWGQQISAEKPGQVAVRRELAGEDEPKTVVELAVQKFLLPVKPQARTATSAPTGAPARTPDGCAGGAP